MNAFSNFPQFSFIESHDSKSDIRIIHATEAEKPSCCKKCGSIEFVKKTTCKPRIVYDVIDGKPSKIIITQARYRCNSCGKTFSENIYFERKKFTSNFEDYIAQTMVNENLSYTDIRKKYGISKGSTSKILGSYIDRFNEQAFKIESCRNLYIHKFQYNKIDRCCICGSNWGDTFDLKLLGIYKEYSPEIIKDFYSKISTLDNIEVIFHNYDPLVTETLSQKFRSIIAINPKDFLKPFWVIADKNYYPEDEKKNRTFKKSTKNFYNKIDQTLIYPTKSSPSKLLHAFSILRKELQSIFSQPMTPLISNKREADNIFQFTKEKMKMDPICDLIEKFRSTNTPFEVMYIRMMILSNAVRKEIKTSSLGRYITKDPTTMYMSTGLDQFSTEFKNNIPVRYVDVNELIEELNENYSPN